MDSKLQDKKSGGANVAAFGQRVRWAAVTLLAGVSIVTLISCEHGGSPADRSSDGTVLKASAGFTQPSVGHPTTQLTDSMGSHYPPAKNGRELKQTKEESASCVACHGESDSFSMHAKEVAISCIDCHGGNIKVAGVADPASVATLPQNSPAFIAVKEAYHGVKASLPALWKKDGVASAANPSAPGAATLQENTDYIRFVNPGDNRAAAAACGACHNGPEDKGGFAVDHVRTSMMTHGAMLWSAAMYNNGSINRKVPVYGESYGYDGKPNRIFPTTRPTVAEAKHLGWLTSLMPLPRWEISQPGNILRVFEDGGKFRPAIGVPDTFEDAGKPDVKLSVRGRGTDLRTDPVIIGLQKTRLLDPTLSLFGTNDHPGDFRGSGCSACHVVYGNDRSPVHSAKWAKYGNRGESFSADKRVNPSGVTDPAVPSTQPGAAAVRESGHPIKHVFEKSVPTSNCIVCHIHPGTNVVNAFLGFTWWDNETDGEFMYPKNQKYPSTDTESAVNKHNPEGTAPRGLWSNLYPNDVSHAGKVAGRDFLENLASLNPLLKHTQFADFHGHGWIFRAVFKQDRHGTMLNPNGEPLKNVVASQMAEGIAYQSGAIPLPDLDDLKDDKDVKDVKTALLAAQDKPMSAATPVHLKDVHLEKGMQCVDCHFTADNHGNGHLYGETRNAVLVECVDCHGTVSQPPLMIKFLMQYTNAHKATDAAGFDLLQKCFTGNAAAKATQQELEDRAKLIGSRFKVYEAADGQLTVLFQKSAMDKDAKTGWYVKQVAASARSTAAVLAQDDAAGRDRARYAHTVRRDPKSSDRKLKFGLTPEEDKKLLEGNLEQKSLCLAHNNDSMACYACHTSWNTSCFGCHLPMKANQKKPMLHNEGTETRNYTNYNFQTLRDDVFMLGVDSTVKGHKVVPVRSACAVVVSSQDANRQWIYTQQQTVSAEGFAGTAFSPYFPHTVRTRETKQCADCHLSEKKDNNAIMAQVLLQGTNAVNFIGRFAWVAEGDEGLQAVVVTERDEPQAVIGSKLHKLAYPNDFAAHQTRNQKLTEAHGHEGTVYDVQLRGEYLYAACGEDGFVAYDVANVDNKGFSERIVTAPVSPLGQRLYVRTKFATSVCSPSTLAIDPTRGHLDVNEEGRPHAVYSYLYVTDREEGLVVIGNPADSKNGAGVSTLLDGNPENNFLERAATFNPDGVLSGAKHIVLNGHYAYISCARGLAVVNLNVPTKPKLETFLFNGKLKHPRKVAVQFRYAFVCDDDGVKVLDVTDPAMPKLIPGAFARVGDARDIYICRTYGYVAAGSEGLIVLDLEKPEAPRRKVRFDANGEITDATAVRVGMTNTSLFAYIADGRNGLRVVQLTKDETPGFLGFSPLPVPELIASYATRGPAISLSKGLDRDRAVDECGDQLAVFGRRGARPFNALEQRRLFLNDPTDPSSGVWTVSNEPTDKVIDVSKTK